MSCPETSTAVLTTNSGKPRYYFFSTKAGTDLSTFEDFVKALLDGGKGAKMVIPTLSRQYYQTELAFSQATAVAKQPFIHYIDPVIALKSMDGHDVRDDSNPKSRL